MPNHLSFLHCDAFVGLLIEMSFILFLVILSTAFLVSSSTFDSRAYKRRVRSQRASKSMANLLERHFEYVMTFIMVLKLGVTRPVLDRFHDSSKTRRVRRGPGGVSGGVLGVCVCVCSFF